jgi:hypothetical protein
MSYSIIEVTHSDIHDSENDIIGVLEQRRDTPTSIAKPVRPIEFSLWMAFPLVALFTTLVVVLGIIFAKAHTNGMFLARRSFKCYLEKLTLTLYRTLTSLFKHHCAKYSRELHSDSYSNID